MDPTDCQSGNCVSGSCAPADGQANGGACDTLLLRDRPADAPDVASLRSINRAGEHLLGLVDSVLDLAKIESHKYTLAPVDVDLRQFLVELLELMRRPAESKGLTLDLDPLSSFLRYVRADRNKLRQVLLNIVGNAIKFTDSGGVSLKVMTGSQLHDDDSVDLSFAISDTGPGVHPEDLERIFKPFEQAAHQPKAGGTGLGLALAREFVRLIGGDVHVTSEVGKGSVFTFVIRYLPIGAQALAQLQAPPPGEITAIEGAAGLRVLIVEDHPENRLVLRQLLAPYGFEMAEAENGQVGVRLACPFCGARVTSLLRVLELPAEDTAQPRPGVFARRGTDGRRHRDV